MTENEINVRLQHMTGSSDGSVPPNLSAAPYSTMVPRKGEIVYYADLKDMKVGDGVTILEKLPFNKYDIVQRYPSVSNAAGWYKVLQYDKAPVAATVPGLYVRGVLSIVTTYDRIHPSVLSLELGFGYDDARIHQTCCSGKGPLTKTRIVTNLIDSHTYVEVYSGSSEISGGTVYYNEETQYHRKQPKHSFPVLLKDDTDYSDAANGAVLAEIGLSRFCSISANGVLSAKFVKAGGTSSQFLKADGSIDGNAYALAGHTHNQYLPLTAGSTKPLIDMLYIKSTNGFLRFIDTNFRANRGGHARALLSLLGNDNTRLFNIINLGEDDMLTYVTMTFGDWNSTNALRIYADKVTWGDRRLLDAGDVGGTISAVGHGHAWNEITGRPATYAPSPHAHAFSELSSRPTTLAGYGITDAAPSEHKHPVSLSVGDGASNIALSAGQKYKLEAGGESIVFTTPPDRDTRYSNATPAAPGLMSAADKAKLDGIAGNANHYTLPAASATTLGGVKVGEGLSISDGVLSARAAGGGVTRVDIVGTSGGGIIINGSPVTTEGTVTVKHANSVAANTEGTLMSANDDTLTYPRIKYDANGHVTGTDNASLPLPQKYHEGIMSSSGGYGTEASHLYVIDGIGTHVSPGDTLILKHAAGASIAVKDGARIILKIYADYSISTLYFAFSDDAGTYCPVYMAPGLTLAQARQQFVNNGLAAVWDLLFANRHITFVYREAYGEADGMGDYTPAGWYVVI